MTEKFGEGLKEEHPFSYQGREKNPTSYCYCWCYHYSWISWSLKVLSRSRNIVGESVFFSLNHWGTYKLIIILSSLSISLHCFGTDFALLSLSLSLFLKLDFLFGSCRITDWSKSNTHPKQIPTPATESMLASLSFFSLKRYIFKENKTSSFKLTKRMSCSRQAMLGILPSFYRHL